MEVANGRRLKPQCKLDFNGLDRSRTGFKSEPSHAIKDFLDSGPGTTIQTCSPQNSGNSGGRKAWESPG